MNTKKTAITIVAAMMAIAMITTVAMAVICEKPCGTKVEQCDKETTFVLHSAEDAQIVVSDHGTVYVDMDYDDGNTISAGDIRLTWYHTNYPPNTKVGVPYDGDSGNGDNGDDIADVPDQDILTYADINGNDKFDLYDPVYVDMDNSSDVSAGDIRITDVPPLDVYNEAGELIYNASEFASRWTVVLTGDADDGWDLWEIGTEVGEDQGDDGYPHELLGWVDGDCTGTWTCEDKLYINQPGVTFHIGDNNNNDGCSHFDYFVTIGDTRLYIPPDECVPDCGTKVTQASKDAVYALIIDTGAQIGQYTYGLGEVYINMNDDAEVSIGDVRLTNVSNHYLPNTKVAWCDYYDLGHELTFPNQTIIRYNEMDNLPGYSLGDPLYVDLDNSSDVTVGDIRLTDCPLFVWNGVLPGAYGYAWSKVESELAGDYGDDLYTLPNSWINGESVDEPATVDDLLGYIDSDCSGDWTCVDKLYLQQLVNTPQHDLFVTVGDLRLYIPEVAILEENWPKCGTKVMQCDIDQVYALMYPYCDWVGMDMDYIYAGWVDKNGEQGFGIWNGVADHAYLDMDADGNVSDGDVRLTTVVGKYTTYPPNSKVKEPHDEDLGTALRYDNGWVNMDFGILIFVDMNQNGVYDVTDPLYLDTDWFGPGFGFGVTAGDIRLTDVPVVNCTYGNVGSIGPAWSIVGIGDDDTDWDFFRGTISSLVDDKLIGDFLAIFDADCSGDWTCVDKLYLQQCTYWGYWWFNEGEPDFIDQLISWGFVTAGDHRLYMPTEDGEPPVTPPTWCEYYDMIANGGNDNGKTEINEAWNAIQDYVAGTINPGDAWEVIQCYLADR